MSENIVTQPARNGNFETAEDLVQALEHLHGQTFRSYYDYVGGHGYVLVAEGTNGDEPQVVEMLVDAISHGWMIGRWAPNFGHPDPAATLALVETTQ
jgi:hypothetical protein